MRVTAWLLRHRPMWFGEFAGVSQQPLFMVLEELLHRVPLVRIEIGQLYFLSLDGMPEIRTALLRGPGVVRRASASDIDDLVRCFDKREEFLERFAQGDHCVVCIAGGAIVGYHWFCDQPTHVESRFRYRIEVPDKFLYAYDAYIDPTYRNSGFWLRSYAYLFALMKDTGKAGILTFVDHGNWPSLRAHLKLGFTRRTRVLAIRVHGWRIFRERSITASFAFLGMSPENSTRRATTLSSLPSTQPGSERP